MIQTQNDDSCTVLRVSDVEITVKVLNVPRRSTVLQEKNEMLTKQLAESHQLIEKLLGINEKLKREVFDLRSKKLAFDVEKGKTQCAAGTAIEIDGGVNNLFEMVKSLHQALKPLIPSYKEIIDGSKSTEAAVNAGTSQLAAVVEEISASPHQNDQTKLDGESMRGTAPGLVDLEDRAPRQKNRVPKIITPRRSISLPALDRMDNSEDKGVDDIAITDARSNLARLNLDSDFEGQGNSPGERVNLVLNQRGSRWLRSTTAATPDTLLLSIRKEESIKQEQASSADLQELIKEANLPTTSYQNVAVSSVQQSTPASTTFSIFSLPTVKIPRESELKVSFPITEERENSKNETIKID